MRKNDLDSEKIALNVKWGTISFKADPKKVYREILSIGNDVKPEQIVEYAERHKNSDLHKCFTWDDAEAARKFRISQAQKIVQNIVVEYKKPENPKEPQIVRVLHRASTSVNAGYKPLTVICKNDDLYAGLLAEAKASLIAFRKKYSILSELKPIFELIDALP